jgi:hypothetical protein
VSGDAFPSVRTDEIDVDESLAMLEGSADLFSPVYGREAAEIAHNFEVYQAAHEAEEEFPGFIRDEISVKGAHMCALVDDFMWETIHNPIVPSEAWLAARIAETGGKC